jgi:hypothetical protein
MSINTSVTIVSVLAEIQIRKAPTAPKTSQDSLSWITSISQSALDSLDIPSPGGFIHRGGWLQILGIVSRRTRRVVQPCPACCHPLHRPRLGLQRCTGDDPSKMWLQIHGDWLWHVLATGSWLGNPQCLQNIPKWSRMIFTILPLIGTAGFTSPWNKKQMVQSIRCNLYSWSTMLAKRLGIPGSNYLPTWRIRW